MPFKDPASRARYLRIYRKKNPEKRAIDMRQGRDRLRTQRHGHWRQICANYLFMCAYCGADTISDLHEPFGELPWGFEHDNNGNGKFQQRIPLCYDCHTLEHDGVRAQVVNHRKNLPLYVDDIQWEIEREGSLELWTAKYQVVIPENVHYAYQEWEEEDWRSREERLTEIYERIGGR
jgi:hypothetical protein